MAPRTLTLFERGFFLRTRLFLRTCSAQPKKGSSRSRPLKANQRRILLPGEEPGEYSNIIPTNCPKVVRAKNRAERDGERAFLRLRSKLGRERGVPAHKTEARNPPRTLVLRTPTNVNIKSEASRVEIKMLALTLSSSAFVAPLWRSAEKFRFSTKKRFSQKLHVYHPMHTPRCLPLHVPLSTTPCPAV